MKNKKPQIFNLNTQEEEVRTLQILHNFILKAEWNKLISQGEIALRRFPHSYFFIVMLSIGYAEKGKMDKCFKILQEGINKFPNSYEIAYQLGKRYEETEDYDKAEEYYLKSLNNTPQDYTDGISDCYNDLGVIAFYKGNNKMAKEYWELSLKANPGNINAANNLSDMNTEKADGSNFIKYLNLFIDIQSEKYLKSISKKEFTSIDEAEKVSSFIMETWNQKISSEKEKQDNYSIKEIVDWFYSIDLDFNTVNKMSTGEKQKKGSTLSDIDALDKNFPFLPENGILLLPFAIPALEAVGYPQSRLEKIVNGIRADRHDIEIIRWAHDIADMVAAGVLEKNESEKNDLFEEAYNIALEELDEDTSNKVVDSIRFLISKEFKEKPFKKKR